MGPTGSVRTEPLYPPAKRPVDAMGTITLYVAASLDGFIAAEDGGVAWLEADAQDAGGAMDASYEAFFSSVDALVMGSTTYEQILGFGDWPYDDKPTYVLTERDLPKANDGVRFADGDVEALAERLRREHEHLWLIGGAQTAQAFLRTGHVDAIRITLIPILLGRGIRLFEGADERKHLDLVETTRFGGGEVELHYAVDEGSG